MDSGYQQEPVSGGGVRFTVVPASVPRARAAPLGLALLFVALVMGFTPPRTEVFALVIRLTVGVYGGWWIHTWTRRWLADRVDKVRSPGGTFVVTPTSILAGGRDIRRDQISRLVVRNGMPHEAAPADPSAKPPRLGARSRAGDWPRAASVCYMLCAESERGSTTLAGGMSEHTAHGLLADVSRVLRLSGKDRSDRFTPTGI